MYTNKIYRYDIEIRRYEDHWGELSSRQKRTLPADIVRSIIMGAEKHESPKDYLFALPEEEKEEDNGAPDNFPINEVIRHTIRLNFYSKRLQRYIRALAIHKKEYRGPSLSELGKVPEMVVRRKDWLRTGQAPRLPPLDKEVIRRMLEKAVLSILAQTGYDRVRRTALDTLVDVVAELISKICQLAHVFAQHDLNRGQVAYDDVLEKSLRTVGLNGIHAVKDYYKKRVLLKRDRAHARARRLLAMYDKLLNKYGFSSSIPEIHFPANSRQSSDALQAILKPGFKMLMTLDQEAQQPSESSTSQQ